MTKNQTFYAVDKEKVLFDDQKNKTKQKDIRPIKGCSKSNIDLFDRHLRSRQI